MMKQEVEEFMLRAAEHGDIRLLRSAIDNGADVNYADKKSGFTALHLACYYGHLDIASHLLSLSSRRRRTAVDVNALTNDHYTPLMLAAVNEHSNIVQLLLSQPVQPDMMLSTLPLTPDDEHSGFTVLHLAVMSYNSDILRAVAEGRSSAFYCSKSNMGYTALQLATEMRLTRLALELLGYEKESFVDIHGNSFYQNNRKHGLHRDSTVSGKMGSSYVASLHESNAEGSTPLHSACISQNVELVRAFLSHGADVDAADALGLTPLHWAALTGSDAIMQVLLQHGADPHNAVMLMDEQQHHVLKVLQAQDVTQEQRLSLQRYAWPNCIERTPLMDALLLGHTAVAEALLKSGADPLQNSVDGKAPMHAAARSGNAASVQLLLDTGAFTTKDHCKDIVDSQIGVPPLIVATESGDVETVLLLLQHYSACTPSATRKDADIAAKLAERLHFDSLADAIRRAVNELPAFVTITDEAEGSGNNSGKAADDGSSTAAAAAAAVEEPLASSGCSGDSKSAPDSESLAIEREGGLGTLHTDMKQLNYDVTGDWESGSDADAPPADGRRQSFIDEIIEVMDDQFQSTFAELDAKLRVAKESSSGVHLVSSVMERSSSCSGSVRSSKSNTLSDDNTYQSYTDAASGVDSSHASSDGKVKGKQRKNKGRRHKNGKIKAQPRSSASSPSSCASLSGRKQVKCLQREYMQQQRVGGDSDEQSARVCAAPQRRFMVLPGESESDEYLFVGDEIRKDDGDDDGTAWVAASDLDFNTPDDMDDIDSKQSVSRQSVGQSDIQDPSHSQGGSVADSETGFCVDPTRWAHVKKAARKHRKQAKMWLKTAAMYKNILDRAHRLSEGTKSELHEQISRTAAAAGNSADGVDCAMNEYDRLYLNAVCVLLLLISLSLVVFIRYRL